MDHATGLQGMGTRILLFISWIRGTVLWTVSPQPGTLQLCSLRDRLSSRSGNCQRWWTVLRSPIWTNQAPTPSMTSLLARSPVRQWVSHSRRLPGCRVYERSSKTPPSWRGEVVGQKENSCMSETLLELIKVFSLRSNSGKSGCC